MHIGPETVLPPGVQAKKDRINELVELLESTANGIYLLKVISANENVAFHVIISR